MIPLKFVYVANILVCAWISFHCLSSPTRAHQVVFEQAFAVSESIRLVGALWGAIFVCSVLGLFFPKGMALILLFQLIYKSTWLLAGALPALLANQPYPKAMTVVFVVWVLMTPLAIPWRDLFAG